MASHRLRWTMRAVLSLAAVVTAASMTASVSLADPSPTAPPTGTPLQQYEQLSQRASDVNNQLLAAQDDQTAKNAQLAKANADLAVAKQAQTAAVNQESALRGQVDQLTEASYEGARFSDLSALLTGSSVRDYLDKATLLQEMAENNTAALDKMQQATNAATAAAQRAQSDEQTATSAANAANALVAQITQEKAQLAPLVAAAQKAATKLSPGALSGGGLSPGSFIAPAGTAGAAMKVAMAQIGKPYHWGSTGPSEFDCSGLMFYSWGQVGVSLPRSSQAQSGVGQLISNRADLQPGDLVFFGTSGHIHHVGMYVGNGDMVNAPDTGQDVKIEPLFSDYAWGRRIAG